MKNLLLDTCVFLWFMSDDTKLPHEVKKAIVDPANRIFLSVVSLWESGLKQKIKRIDFPLEAALYLQQQRKRHLIQSLPIDEGSVLHLAKLPDLHRDPFDRMLICQSMEHGLTLVTPDEAIRQYPVKTMWTGFG